MSIAISFKRFWWKFSVRRSGRARIISDPDPLQENPDRRHHRQRAPCSCSCCLLTTRVWSPCTRRRRHSTRVQHDLATMSATITQRLCFYSRDPASHLLACKPPALPRKSPFANATLVPTPQRGLSWARPRVHQAPLKRPISRNFASWGFLFIDPNPTSTASTAVLAPCAANAEKPLHSSSRISRQTLTTLARQAWRREIHSSARRRERGNAKRNKSSATNTPNARKPPPNGSHTTKSVSTAKKAETRIQDSKSTGYLHLPHMHRPTKEELLAAATGFWSRLKIRFKWFSIRSARPWNVDDWSAFVSWFVLGNIVWILVGTTTFFSLVILSINTVVAQGKYPRFRSHQKRSSDTRNTSKMGWRLPNPFSWREGSLRVRNCTKVEKWCDHFSQCVCL